MDLFSSGVVSVVFIPNALRYMPRVCVIPHAYSTNDNSTSDNSKRVTRVSQFTTVEQEREHEIERLGKRQTLVLPTWLQELKMAKLPSPFAECGTLFVFFMGLCGVVACRFPSLSIPFPFSFSCFIVVN